MFHNQASRSDGDYSFRVFEVYQHYISLKVSNLYVNTGRYPITHTHCGNNGVLNANAATY